jgi:hypothetical protein
LVHAIQALVHHPVRYRRLFDDPTRRMLVVREYRVIYTVNPDTGDNRTAGDVTVLAVLGPGEP